MKKLAWLIPLVAAGCGRAHSQPPAPLPTVLVANPYQRLVVACTDGAALARRAMARRYCECVYREAARRWTYEYFNENVARCEAELDETVSERCEKESLQ